MSSTLVQRLSDFYPTKQADSQEPFEATISNFTNYPFPQDVKDSAQRIYYNSIDGNSFNFNDFDFSQNGGYLNYLQLIEEVYEGSTYRYNVTLGKNRINALNGNNNIYIGTNTSSNSITTSNTISIGHNITPIDDHIIIRSNTNKGIIDIQTPKGSNEKCYVDLYSNINIALTGSNIGYEDTDQHVKTCNIHLTGSDLNINNADVNISSPLTIVGNSISVGTFVLDGVLKGGNSSLLVNSEYLEIKIGSATYKIQLFR